MAVDRAGTTTEGPAGFPSKKTRKKAAKSAKKSRKAAVPSAGIGKGRVSHSTMLSRDEAVAYFEAIVGGLRVGSVHFRQGGRRVVLHPSDHLTLTIKARDGSKKGRVSFELSWRRQSEADDKD
jgi:amphi-Trp domain-containing protein